MGEISILDLQNLRHLIGGYATTYHNRHQSPHIDPPAPG